MKVAGEIPGPRLLMTALGFLGGKGEKRAKLRKSPPSLLILPLFRPLSPHHGLTLSLPLLCQSGALTYCVTEELVELMMFRSFMLCSH